MHELIVGQRSMPFLFLVAAVVTILLGLLFVGSIVAGLVFCFVPRLRGVAPFILFIPTLSAFGAAGGAWGLGYAAHTHAPMSALPFWGWVVGLPVGAVLGLLIGACLALLITRVFPKTAQPGAPPNSRPPCQLPTSPDVQTPDSLRMPPSGGCG